MVDFPNDLWQQYYMSTANDVPGDPTIANGANYNAVIDELGATQAFITSTFTDNAVTNATPIKDTAGWALYADAAGATPVDGIGGVANLTWARSATAPLSLKYSFLLTKDAVNRQGEGVAYTLTLPLVQRGVSTEISFEYGSGGAYASGDCRVYVYDVTGTTLITPDVVDIPSGTGVFSTVFAATSSSQYRLVFHTASTNASAWTLKLNRVRVGRSTSLDPDLLAIAALGSTGYLRRSNTNTWVLDTALTSTQIGFGSATGATVGSADLTFNSTTGVLATKYLKLDTAAAAPTHVEGTAYWDTADHCFSIMSEVAGSVLCVGQENWIRIVNKTGAQLNDGAVVYISGAQGNRPTAALAIATSGSSDRTIGLVTNNIADNAEGYVTVFGIVHGYDTSLFTAGDALYVSPSVAGQLTNVAPTAPNHAIRVGYALNSTNNGQVFVNTHEGAELNHLHDVLLTAPANKDALRYVTAQTRWENTNQGAWLDTAQTFTALQTHSAGLTVSSGTTAMQATTCRSLVATDVDEASQLIASAASAKIRMRGYAAAIGGAIIDASNPSESAYVPIAITGSTVRLMPGGVAGLTMGADLSATFAAGITCTSLSAGTASAFDVRLTSDGSYYGVGAYYDGGWKRTTANLGGAVIRNSGGILDILTSPSSAGAAGTALVGMQSRLYTTDAGDVRIANITASTGGGTGALVVTGGIGSAGASNVFSGSLGLGGAYDPSSRLRAQWAVTGTSDSRAAYFDLYARPASAATAQYVGETATVIADQANNNLATSSLISSYKSVVVNVAGNATVGTALSVFSTSAVINSGAPGTTTAVTTVYNLYARLDMTATNAGATALVTTYYGLCLAEPSLTGAGTKTITTNYGVFQQDTTAKNYFAGIAGFGVVPTASAGLIQMPAGTTAAGGIAFGSDSLYRSAAGQLTIDTTGTPSLRLKTASNVYANITFSPFGADQVVLNGSSYGLEIAGTYPYLHIGYSGNLGALGLAVNGSAAFGANALVSAERARFAGGTIATPGATDVCIGGGAIYSGAGITSGGLLLTTLSGTGGAMFRLPHGAAPTSPVNGDVWTTTAGMYARINGGTAGPFLSGTASLDSVAVGTSTGLSTVTGFTASTGGFSFTQAVRQSGGIPSTGFNISNATLSSMPASTECPFIVFDLARTITWNAGALTTQREVKITAPTYAFASASTLTTAATVSITGAPTAGTNATITTALALWIEAGCLQTAASTTTVAGLRAPHGSAPSAPENGDIWTTTAGLFVRINGVTKTVTLT